MTSKELVPVQKKLTPKIVDEEGNKIVGPEMEAVTGMVTQMAQLAQLARMRKSMERQEAQMEKVPVGKMRPFEKLITGDTIERWEVIDDIGQKCTSGTVYNDGPDSCWIALNDIRDGFQEVKEGESLDFSFKHPVIERFFWYTTADGTANLRIPLEY
ncbi:hypothetical protein KKF82_06815 [Patescibacteria group bacterium]|nr:hypothetical protein [Patescibacteria group bacterium]